MNKSDTKKEKKLEKKEQEKLAKAQKELDKAADHHRARVDLHEKNFGTVPIAVVPATTGTTPAGPFVPTAPGVVYVDPKATELRAQEQRLREATQAVSGAGHTTTS